LLAPSLLLSYLDSSTTQPVRLTPVGVASVRRIDASGLRRGNGVFDCEIHGVALAPLTLVRRSRPTGGAGLIAFLWGNVCGFCGF